jgi:hypothetical protein
MDSTSSGVGCIVPPKRKAVKRLTGVLVTLNLLAFLMHTVLGLMDANYQLVRQKLVTRKNFFNDLRALTRYLCFDS